MKRSMYACRMLFLAGFLFASRQAFNQTNTDTFRILACNHFWKTGASVPATTIQINPLNLIPTIPPSITETDSGDCKEFKFSPGFNFSNFCPTGSGDSGHANGVTVADLIILIKHILGTAPLEPDILRVVADANKNNSITTTDIVEWRKLILGIYLEPPNNTSWRSFSNDLVYTPNDMNPFMPAWSCTYQFDSTKTKDTIELNAFKMGDLDGDANPDGPYMVPQNLPFATLSIPDLTLQAGQTIQVPVYMNVDQAIMGFQIGFALDTALGSFMGVSSDAFPMNASNNTGIFAGAFNMLAFSDIPVDIIAGQPLFYLMLKANQTFQVKNALTINTGIMPALWVDANETVHPFETALTTRLLPEPSAGVRVLPPSPNPFHDYTSIRVESIEAETALIEIFDNQGRTFWTNEFHLNAGDNFIEIPGGVMATGSLAFYRLYASDWMASGKLIRQ